MNPILEKIREELRRNSDEKIRENGKRFFKEEVNTYGISSAQVGQIAKLYFQEIKGLEKKQILELCEDLWKSGMMEESFIACSWSDAVHPQFEEKDFQTLERWVGTYVSNWASCDTLCNHTVGSFIDLYPSYLKELKRWAKSENRWMKRAAAVSLIIPARKGRYLADIFEIAGLLLTDTDDLVQKGYGWMLKAASQAHETEVFEYVMKHKTDMPRTALRYAIEKMSTELKKQAMAKP